MEILRIGKYAIKISLSDAEAKEYKILECESLEEKEIKAAFAKLLKNTNEAVDFLYSGRKIFTEIYPNKNGGCEVFISTVNVDNKASNEKIQKDIKKSRLQHSIYEISSLETLLKIAFRLKEIEFDGKSSVYYNEQNQNYILVLEETYSKELKYAFILEYGKLLKSNLIYYIKEHFKCVAKKDGVKILALLGN